MFKKSATYKPAATIRNSERKALAAEVQLCYSAAFQNTTAEEVKALLELILPSSGIESSSFTTTKGQRGLLYTHHSDPIFVRLAETLVPTLQTIWKCPTMIPTVLTGAQVLANLQTGSDLMVKGMFDFSPSVKAGAVVGIRVTDRSHIVAVGLAAIDFDKVKREDGGKGVLTYICMGDTITPEESYPAMVPRKEEIDALQSLSLENVQGAKSQESCQEEIPQDLPAMTIEEIDDSFVQALLYGLYSLSSVDRQSTLSLPISSSSLIDTYVLPFLPSTHPDLVLKKTTWKKATKFISRQKFLKTKDNKGQVMVTGIDWDSSELETFVPYRLPKSKLAENSTTNSDSTHAEEESRQVVDIEYLYKVPSTLDPLIVSKLVSDYLTTDHIRTHLDEYFLKNNLVTSNPKLITIDPQLYHLLGNKTSQKQLSREILYRNMTLACIKHYRINGGKIKKGSPPAIEITMESRQGRKSITRVSHLEPYFNAREIESICNELKKKCAVSVSTGEVKGTKPGTTVEITIQGKKSLEAKMALESRGISAGGIKVSDKSK